MYAMGFSSGGMLSHRLACELSDRVRAIAAVGGTLAESVAASCAPARPVSVLMFHGTDDALAPYGGGRTQRGRGGPTLSFNDAQLRWARWNGCAPGPVRRTEPDAARDGTTVERTLYGSCRDGVEVEAFTIHGGGHTWPGTPEPVSRRLLGKTTRDISATEIMANFFLRQSPRGSRP
jgi:polyhydroxybutyrate depolymerase